MIKIFIFRKVHSLYEDNVKCSNVSLSSFQKTKTRQNKRIAGTTEGRFLGLPGHSCICWYQFKGNIQKIHHAHEDNFELPLGVQNFRESERVFCQD